MSHDNSKCAQFELVIQEADELTFITAAMLHNGTGALRSHVYICLDGLSISMSEHSHAGDFLKSDETVSVIPKSLCILCDSFNVRGELEIKWQIRVACF